jgi:hypothetical protein
MGLSRGERMTATRLERLTLPGAGPTFVTGKMPKLVWIAPTDLYVDEPISVICRENRSR